MNWYQRYKLAQIQGEYWITAEGQAMGADGDTGDYNHEAYVIELVQHEFNEDDRLPWPQFQQKIAQEKLREKLSEIEAPQKQQELQKQYQANMLPFAIEGLHELGMTDEQMAIADGNGDGRAYAMKNLGWKRLQGYNIETWTLTSQDLRAIANGLWEAYDDRVESETFNIFVFANDKWYTDVPWEDIQTENPMKVVQYRETQFAGKME